MFTQKYVLKELRKHARSQNMIFKTVNDRQNGAQCWAFFGDFGQKSVRQPMRCWVDDFSNGEIKTWD